MRADRDAIRELRRAQAAAEARGEPGLRYRLGDLLGSGGMGAVYRGQRIGDGLVVALKVMLPEIAVDEEMRAMFQREIESMDRLRHPNLVAMIEFGSVGDVFYVAMELCSRGSVQNLLEASGGRLSVREAAPILLDALAGLSYAHENGFVHRDIKPQNILIDANGRAKLGDFGLAKSFELAGLSGFTATGTYAGTITFMPREQLINYKYVKPPADVFSMGASAYFMLTGRAPRDAAPGADPRRAVLDASSVPIRERDPSIPTAVAAVIDRAVARRADDRFRSAVEFREALLAALPKAGSCYK